MKYSPAAVVAAAALGVLLCVSVQVQSFSPWKASSMLVFGDSTVDPGNNNRLETSFKANFLPYGKDFFDGQPTGRFSNGRLATDFIAEEMGISTSIPAFLDPNLSSEQLKRGVSFASASSGYDEQTAKSANVLTIPQQIEYLKHYKIHLTRSVGPREASRIIRNSMVVISAGTNDFIQNYYFYTNRSKEFTVPQYQDYLVTLMSKYIKDIHGVGAKRFVLVGIPPMGCLPVVRTILDSKGCVSAYNDVAVSMNSKLLAELAALRKELGIRTAYLDIYRILTEATDSPRKYGIAEASKGCCGSGTIEFGETCKGQSTCEDPSKYMYWDAVHPTEAMYKIIAQIAMKDDITELLRS